MFREEVLDHYRVRGYQLHERVKVRGSSGSIHGCDLVAQGPLGNLIVTFGDDDMHGPELAALKRTAKDIGAGAVLALETPTPKVQQAAVANGVKILDRQAISRLEPIIETPPEVDDHPWPEQEFAMRNRGGGGTSTIWKHERKAPKREADRFAWLGTGHEQPRAIKPAQPALPAPEPRGGPAPHVPAPEPRPIRKAPVPTFPDEPLVAAPPRNQRADLSAPTVGYVKPPFPWHRVWMPLLFGGAAAGVYFLIDGLL